MRIEINTKNGRSQSQTNEGCPAKVNSADLVVYADDITGALSILKKSLNDKYVKKITEQILQIEKTVQKITTLNEDIENSGLIVPEMHIVCLPLLGGGFACGEIYEGEFIWDGTLIV